MTTEERVNTTLALKHQLACYEVDCPLLALIAPEVYFAKTWDCGPRTFDFLLDCLLDNRALSEEEREAATQKVLEGKWDLFYRDAPIRRGPLTPEDRLWPA